MKSFRYALMLALLLIPSVAWDQAPISQQWVERGQLVKRIRAAFSMTQANFASHIGSPMTATKLSRFERGVDSLPSGERRLIFVGIRNLLADSITNQAGDWFYSEYRAAMPRNP